MNSDPQAPDPGPAAAQSAGGPAAPESAPPAAETVLPPDTTPPVASGRRRRPGAVLVAVALVVVLAGTALFVSGWTLGRHAAMTPGTPADEAEVWQPFWDTYRAVTERYAGGDVDRKVLVEGAIKGMIGALDDPYSAYLTSDEFRATLQDISGEFEGVGATIGTVDAEGATSSCATIAPDCRLVVLSPIKDSPADRAGLLPGDVIAAIDGVSLDGLTVDEARDRIRGPKDTAVVLSVVRGDGAPFDVEIVRAVIVSPEVESEALAGGRVGYIRLSGFSDHAAEQFDRAVAEHVAAGRKQLVVDLRGNPGGFVTAARNIASQFLADGTIFWEEDADGNRIETLAESGGAATDPAIEVVLLVDGGTASASEIVAGALQDRGRATLVGSTTLGKGTVQQWTQLEGDHGGFRLTVARWLTPDGTWIHRKGIEPDVTVTEVPERPGDDPVLDRALELLSPEAAGSGRRAAA